MIDVAVFYIARRKYNNYETARKITVPNYYNIYTDVNVRGDVAYISISIRGIYMIVITVMTRRRKRRVNLCTKRFFHPPIYVNRHETSLTTSRAYTAACSMLLDITVRLILFRFEVPAVSNVSNTKYRLYSSSAIQKIRANETYKRFGRRFLNALRVYVIRDEASESNRFGEGKC